MLLDKTCTWIFFYLSFHFLTIFYIHSWFPFSFSSLFLCYLSAGGGWGENGGQLGFLFISYLHICIGRKGRKDTIVSGGDSKESWIGGRSGGKRRCISYFFFIYIGKISQTNTFLSASFLSKFSHFSHFGFSPFFSFPLHSRFFSLSFFFFTLTSLPYLTFSSRIPIIIVYVPAHSFIHSPIYPSNQPSTHSTFTDSALEISLTFTCYHNYFTLL